MSKNIVLSTYVHLVRNYLVSTIIFETLHFDEKLSCNSFEFFSTQRRKLLKKSRENFVVDIPETIFRPSKGAFGRLLLTFVLAAGVGVGFDTVLVWILEIE